MPTAAVTPTTTTNLGAMLALYRVANGLTVHDFPQLDISAAQLSRIERGHAIDGVTLIKLMAWLLAPRASNATAKEGT